MSKINKINDFFSKKLNSLPVRHTMDMAEFAYNDYRSDTHIVFKKCCDLLKKRLSAVEYEQFMKKFK